VYNNGFWNCILFDQKNPLIIQSAQIYTIANNGNWDVKLFHNSNDPCKFSIEVGKKDNKKTHIRTFILVKVLPFVSLCTTLGPLHTRDWEPVTISLQAFSVVEKVEGESSLDTMTLCHVGSGSLSRRTNTLFTPAPSQKGGMCSYHHYHGKGGDGPSSSFVLRLRDQRSMWMQDGCKVYMDSYVASNGSYFVVTWIIFKNHLLEVGLTQNRENHGTPNAHNCWFIMNHSIWLRDRSYMTSHYTWRICDHTRWFWRCVGKGRPSNTFFWALTISWSQLLARVRSGPQSLRLYAN
jgi:hypothetical protein